MAVMVSGDVADRAGLDQDLLPFSDVVAAVAQPGLTGVWRPCGLVGGSDGHVGAG
jgi:hypothetical protein